MYGGLTEYAVLSTHFQDSFETYKTLCLIKSKHGSTRQDAWLTRTGV